MPIIVTTREGARIQVVAGDDEEIEFENLLNRAGAPYNKGWIRVHPPDPPHYVKYDEVVKAEIQPAG